MTLYDFLIENADKAKEYAEKAHEGQYRKFAGEKYVEHPKRVAEIVKRFKKSHKIDALVNAALLHDTVEDTNTTIEDLKKMFGGLVASLVNELTSNKEKIKQVGKTPYLSDKMKNMSSWGLVIKLADRLDNVSDLKNASPEFANKYSKETWKIINNLEKTRRLSKTQKNIVKAIKDKLKELKNEA